MLFVIERKVSWKNAWYLNIQLKIDILHKYMLLMLFGYLCKIFYQIIFFTCSKSHKSSHPFHLNKFPFRLFNRQQCYKILIWIFICKITTRLYANRKSLTLFFLHLKPRWSYSYSYFSCARMEILKNTKIYSQDYYDEYFLRDLKKILLLPSSHLQAKKQKTRWNRGGKRKEGKCK